MGRIPLDRVLVTYENIEHAASEAARQQGFRCEPGCAWCCHSPVVVNHRDVALMTEAVRGLSPEARDAVLTRADEWVARVAAIGVNLDNEHYRQIAAVNAYVIQTGLGLVWPDGGIACPLLAPGDALGRGMCMIYTNRPAACRIYFADRPENDATHEPGVACRPPRREAVAELDTGSAYQKLINALELRSAGILAVELRRAFRLRVVKG